MSTATITGQVDARFLLSGERFTAPAGALVDDVAIPRPDVFTVDDNPIEHDGMVYVPVGYPDGAAGCVELPTTTVVTLSTD